MEMALVRDGLSRQRDRRSPYHPCSSLDARVPHPLEWGPAALGLRKMATEGHRQGGHGGPGCRVLPRRMEADAQPLQEEGQPRQKMVPGHPRALPELVPSPTQL